MADSDLDSGDPVLDVPVSDDPDSDLALDPDSALASAGPGGDAPGSADHSSAPGSEVALEALGSEPASESFCDNLLILAEFMNPFLAEMRSRGPNWPSDNNCQTADTRC